MAQNSGNSDFALRLTQTCCDSKQNLCLSPYSIRMAFSMALNGARGNTLRQMTKVLGFGNSSVAQVNASNTKLIKAISDHLTRDEMVMANSLWLEKTYRLEPSYTRAMNTAYQAPVNLVSMHNSHTVELINQWVADKTQKRIMRMYERISDETLLIIINAVLFKAGWLHPFSPKHNTKATWNGSKGKRPNTVYMQISRDLEYVQAKTHTMVRLPYSISRVISGLTSSKMTNDQLKLEMELQDTLAMYCIMPAEGSSPQKLLSSLTSISLAQMIDSLKIGHVDLSLPRFKMAVETNLIPPLKKMGMLLPFEERADFSGMVPKALGSVKIDDAKQKCVLEVNERGTEAAAATGIGMTLGISLNPPKLTFNRPFVFLIRHDPTGEILFSGVVNDPQ